MPHRYDERERRWRNQDEENRYSREGDRSRRYPWRSQDRGTERGMWEDHDLHDEGGWQGRRGQHEDWMTYGRPEDFSDEGLGQSGYGMRGREEWDRGRMHRQDYDRGRWEDRNDWDRGFDRGRTGRQDYGYQGREDWSARDRSFGRGRMSGQDYGYQGRERGRFDRSGQYGTDWNQRENRYIQNPYDYDDDYDYDEPEWTYTEVWMIEGPFTGMGPQGYRRDDDRICEDICERLTYHGQIDPSDVDVEVNNGEVYLRGKVHDRRSKRMIEDVAETVFGVTDVHNELRVDEQRRQRWTEQGEQQRFGSGRETGQRYERQHEQGSVQSGLGQMGMRGQIRTGMQVVGNDDSSIGEVKELRQNDFLVDRPMARDVYVPFDALEHVSGNRVRLNIPAGEVNDRGWPNPEMIDTDQGENR